MEKTGRAVVIGASIAGLLAAEVLSRRFGEVVVVERDRLESGPEIRKGTPQARHLHVMLAGGMLSLERRFPGIRQELDACGAVRVDVTGELAWMGPAGWGTQYVSGLELPSASRGVIESVIRKRIVGSPRIVVRDGLETIGLMPAGKKVGGVRVRSREAPFDQSEISADLVVDAAGRTSRAPDWLEEIGSGRPTETVIDSQLGYASRTYRRTAKLEGGFKGIYIQLAPPERMRGGLVAPIERDRWIVTLAGTGGDYPPTDDAGFLEFMRSLESTAIFDLVADEEPLSPIAGNRSTANRLRHFDKLRRRPSNFLVTGDAACAFNPVYGQGMSTAALEADALEGCLAVGDDRLANRFQRALVRTVEPAWQMATSEDFRVPSVRGAKPGRGARLLHWYFGRLLRVAASNQRVRDQFSRAVHLVAPPASLFAPEVLLPTLFSRPTTGNPPPPIAARTAVGAT
ncbi:MAG: 2-polyprenyl-6-methoxyphenol hydroxylase-like oxidoreductase [Dehalococcoidia bacterium]